MSNFKLKVQSLLGTEDVDLSPTMKSGKAKGKSKGTQPDSCQKCSLFGSKQVVDPPNSNAKVLIVGEAPGKEEEKEGRCFVGQSGQVLRECLTKAGWSMDDIQFANTCRCRPKNDQGGNRAPTTKERALCKKLYLDRTLERFDKIIVVGKVPEETVLGSANSWIRGHVVLDGKKLIGITYHPAYVLRRRNMRDDSTEATLTDDLKFFKSVLVDGYKPDFTFVDSDISREQCWMDTKGIAETSFDIETTGTKYDSSIVLVGVLGKTKTWVIPVIGKYADNRDLVKEIFSQEETLYIAFNTSFDYRQTFGNGLCARRIKLTDAMLVEYLLDPGRGIDWYKLKGLCGRRGIHWSRLLLDPLKYESIYDLACYNAEDVQNTSALYNQRKPELEKRGLGFVLSKVVNPALNVIGEMEWNGAKINLKEMESLRTKLKRQKKLIEEELVDRFGEYNFGSSIQIQKLLEKLGAKPIRTTETGRWSTDADTLKDYVVKYSTPDSPFGSQSTGIVFLCKCLLQLREISKLLSTYVEGLAKKIDGDGRLRGGFFLQGTATGRLSSSGPNLQNIPRGSRVKSMFEAEEGWTYIEADASQIELRVVASVAPEPIMITAYNSGADLHSLTAGYVLSKNVSEVTKFERQLAKAVNFGLIYGQSAFGFRAYAKGKFDVDLTDAEAKRFRDAFFDRYIGIREWHRRVSMDVENGNRLVTTPFGRIRELFGDDVNGMIRQALNTPIQSAASDCNLLAMRYVWDNVSIDYCRFLLTVHDQFLLAVRKSHFDTLLEIIANSTTHVNNECPWLKVPFELSLKSGSSWGTLEELKS